MFTEFTKQNYGGMIQEDAYTKELKEKNPPKQYAVDPFAEVFTLSDNVSVIRKESGDGHGYVWCYLIEGPRKAMLINTGWGIGNLKGLVEELAHGKEIIPVITWPHKMTSTGNFQFEKVYCQEYAAPVLERLRTPASLDELCDENGDGVYVVCRRSDIIAYNEYEIVPCKDGHVFDLGDGYEIELIWTPGSSPSGASYLDKTARILYTGSFSCRTTMDIGTKPRVMTEYRCNEFATIPAFLDGMRKLQARMDEFDIVRNMDAPLEVPRGCIPDWVAVAKKVMEDPEAYDSAEVINSDHAKNVHVLKRSFNGYSLIYNRKSCIVTE